MRSFGLLFVLTLLAVGCRFFKGDPYKNTTVSGKTYIAVDESVRPVLEAEAELFKAIYGYSEIEIHYLPEAKAFERLLSDSVQLVVASRMLRSDEIAAINNRKLFPKQLKIATDAIALVVHPSCKDSLFSLKQIEEILKGKITTWNQLRPDFPANPIQVLFDHEKSGTVRYLADSLCQGNFSATHAAAMESSREVIEYTASHENVIGFVGTSWIGNRNDSLHLSFHKQIKVAAVSLSDVPTFENSFQPFQAYLLDNKYPLTRSVYMINTEPRNGLATGFVSFVASDKGQRIILKSGLVPVNAPARVVNIRPEL